MVILLDLPTSQEQSFILGYAKNATKKHPKQHQKAMWIALVSGSYHDFMRDIELETCMKKLD
jgi:hypothetical protein